jgi:hypothetical protein
MRRLEELLRTAQTNVCPVSDMNDARPRARLAAVQSIVESGGIAKLYCEHTNREPVGPTCMYNDWARDVGDLLISGFCLAHESRPNSRRYEVVTLIADGPATEQTRIKTRLVREVLADLCGVRGVISANLCVDDASGNQALRACAFMPQAGRVLTSLPLPAHLPSTCASASVLVRADLSESEQSWHDLLHSLGCSLPATTSDAARSQQVPAPSPQSEMVSLTATSEQGISLAGMTLRRTGANEASITRLECNCEGVNSVLATLARSAEDWCNSRGIGLLHAELCASQIRELTVLRSLGFVSVAHYVRFARRL